MTNVENLAVGKPPGEIVSDELKPGRKPSFTNGDQDVLSLNMRDKSIAHMAFQAAYMSTLELKNLPKEG